MGRSWYEDGKLLSKRNTFTDFVAVARHLVHNGYTDAEHVVDIFGRCPECTARARAASGDGNRAR